MILALLLLAASTAALALAWGYCPGGDIGLIQRAWVRRTILVVTAPALISMLVVASASAAITDYCGGRGLWHVWSDTKDLWKSVRDNYAEAWRGY